MNGRIEAEARKAWAAVRRWSPGAVRRALWSAVCTQARKRTPEGATMPWWACAARWVLYPLDTFYWYMGRSHGYHIDSNTWTIHGVRYSDVMFRYLAGARGELYRIVRTGDVVTLERAR